MCRIRVVREVSCATKVNKFWSSALQLQVEDVRGRRGGLEGSGGVGWCGDDGFREAIYGEWSLLFVYRFGTVFTQPAYLFEPPIKHHFTLHT